MSATQRNSTPAWSVTGQTEGTVVAPNGNGVVDGYTVTFVTRTGTHGSVFVAHADYSAANVAALIGAKAAQLDQVAGLTSESGV